MGQTYIHWVIKGWPISFIKHYSNNGAYILCEPGKVQSRHQPKADKRDNQGLFLDRLDMVYNN